MSANNPNERLLTREELAGVLRVSLRTVDTMVVGGEIPHLRMRGRLVRFYLPDVVRHLPATALTRKHGRNAVSAVSRGPGSAKCKSQIADDGGSTGKGEDSEPLIDAHKR